MFLHCFLEEFQSCLLVPGLCYEALKHLAFVIDGAPEVVHLAVDLHEHLVEVPSPVAGLHALDAALADLGSEQRTEAMPPEPHRLVADLDTALMQKILDVPKREREPDVHHHRQTDDLAARLEVLEWVRFGHAETLASALPRLKPSLSDKTLRVHDQASEARDRQAPARPLRPQRRASRPPYRPDGDAARGTRGCRYRGRNCRREGEDHGGRRVRAPPPGAQAVPGSPAA